MLLLGCVAGVRGPASQINCIREELLPVLNSTHINQLPAGELMAFLHNIADVTKADASNRTDDVNVANSSFLNLHEIVVLSDLLLDISTYNISMSDFDTVRNFTDVRM